MTELVIRGIIKLPVLPTGIPLRWWRSSPVAQSTAKARTESLPKSRPIVTLSFHSIQKTGMGETVESCEKKARAGSANLMDKMLG